MSLKNQQGIALITILMMVALATIIAATIAQHQRDTFEHTASLMRQNQSLYYAQSAEAFFSELLKEDAKSTGDVDYLQEAWAKPMPALPVEGGMISGLLLDESGKFNLNHLVNKDGSANLNAQHYFEQLLKRVGLVPESAQAVIDWMDPDDLVIGAMGAESAYYGSLQPAYAVSNTWLQSKEELKQIRGFEGEKYQLIAPYVTAMPDLDSKININTAPALVLAAIDDSVQVNQVAQLMQQRQLNMKYFSNVGELWQLAPFQQLDEAHKQLANELFGVSSVFFKAQIEVNLDQGKRQMSSYLLRHEDKVSVYARSLAPF